MFVASVLIGFTVMQRFPEMKVVVTHGKASWMEEVLEKMEASSPGVIPLLHAYPVRTDTEEMWEEGKVMLGFDAEERLIQKLPQDFAEKVVWGSRYPQHDTTSAHEAIAMLAGADVPEGMIVRMMGGNAAAQFGGGSSRAGPRLTSSWPKSSSPLLFWPKRWRCRETPDPDSLFGNELSPGGQCRRRRRRRSSSLGSHHVWVSLSGHCRRLPHLGRRTSGWLCRVASGLSAPRLHSSRPCPITMTHWIGGSKDLIDWRMADSALRVAGHKTRKLGLCTDVSRMHIQFWYRSIHDYHPPRNEDVTHVSRNRSAVAGWPSATWAGRSTSCPCMTQYISSHVCRQGPPSMSRKCRGLMRGGSRLASVSCVRKKSLYSGDFI